MIYLMHKTLFSFAAFLVILLPVAVFAANSAVVFMYHRFGEGKHPSTNIKIKQFEDHGFSIDHIREAALPQLGHTAAQIPVRAKQKISKTLVEMHRLGSILIM